MTVQKTDTQAKILRIDEGRGRFTIEADVPAFGKYPTKFIEWLHEFGMPPEINAEVMGTFEPTRRQKRFIDDGTLVGDDIDGNEAPWQVNWRMVSFRPLDTSGNAPRGHSTTPGTTAPSNGSLRDQNPVFIDANARYRNDQEGINDRKSVSDILAMVEPGTYTLDGLLEDAERLAAWYNVRLAARIGGGLVGDAQDSGAVMTKVSLDEGDGHPPITNREALLNWVKTMGWSKDAITSALGDEGYSGSAAYLEKEGNTPQGLAELLLRAFAKSQTEGSW